MKPHLLALAFTLTLGPVIWPLFAQEGSSTKTQPPGNAQQVSVTGSSVQAYVDLAAAASCLEGGAKSLLKEQIPSFDPAEIADIHPHRFTAIYDDTVRVFEYLALWVRTEPKETASDPFAQKAVTEPEKQRRLFLVIMVRIKYSGLERWGIQHYFGERPGPLFEAAALELTGNKNTSEAADLFCREWSMLPDPPAKSRSVPHSNPHWLANVLFVHDK